MFLGLQAWGARRRFPGVTHAKARRHGLAHRYLLMHMTPASLYIYIYHVCVYAYTHILYIERATQNRNQVRTEQCSSKPTWLICDLLGSLNVHVYRNIRHKVESNDDTNRPINAPSRSLFLFLGNPAQCYMYFIAFISCMC